MITTIVFKILLIIILVIVILLHFSLTVYIKGGTGSKLVIKVKYLGITVYPRKKKPKKQKKKKEEPEDDFDDDLFDDTDDDISEDMTEDKPENETESVSEDKTEVTLDGLFDEDEEDDKEETSEASSEKDEERSDGKEEKSDDKKEKPDKKKKKKKAEEEETDDGEKKESGLDKLKRKWEFIKPYIPPALKYTKKLLKAVRIEDIKINIDTGKEDAADSAIFYGKLQAALFNTLSALGTIFTVKVKEANVRCLFNVKKLDAEGETNIRVRPSTVIAIAFCLLWCCAKIFIPYKLKQRRAKKKAQKEAKKKAAAEAAAPAQEN